MSALHLDSRFRPTAAEAVPAPPTSRVERQLAGVRISAISYLLYALVMLVQVGYGLMAPAAAATLLGLALAVNLGFYLAVGSGRFSRGRDPGLARTQLMVGIAYLYVGYAASGPSAPGTTIVMASHIVYAMFTMSPQQVHRLVAASLLGLGATQLLCDQLWPERFAPGVQLVAFLYACLVVSLIALLAKRITGMMLQLRHQHAQLAEAMTRLETLATRDELTLTHNRRHMGSLIAAAQGRRQRSAEPIALALLDIDLFKSINDQHGHATGDEVLRHFAAQVRTVLRDTDEVARWGGEEFLVMFPRADATQAMAALGRLQHHLAEAEAGAGAGDAMPAGLRVSFSAGVTELGPNEPAEVAIERADQAMYRAKTSGRARSVRG